MMIWLIWMRGEDHTWLEAAWDDEMTAENHDGWKKEVDRCRKFALDNDCEMRIQSVDVPGVFELFKIPHVEARSV